MQPLTVSINWIKCMNSLPTTKTGNKESIIFCCILHDQVSTEHHICISVICGNKNLGCTTMKQPLHTMHSARQSTTCFADSTFAAIQQCTINTGHLHVSNTVVHNHLLQRIQLVCKNTQATTPLANCCSMK